MDKRCIACGGQLEPGVIQAHKTSFTGGRELFGLVAHLTFVRRGEPQPPPKSIVQAIVQGWREGSEPRMPLEAFRCVGCGRVELYAGGGETSGT